MYNYLIKFFMYLLGFIIIDKSLGNKIKGKYYLVHFLNNMYIVYLCLPDVYFSYFHFNDFIKYPSNYEAAIITFAIHFYHTIIYWNKLRYDDLLHHILMILVALPISFLAKTGSLLGHSLFYTTGLPGGIDYLMLVLVRNGIINKLTEKKVNNYLNLWIRCPGCIAHGTLTLVGYNMVKDIECISIYCFYYYVITGLIVFWNGIYFMNQVVVNYSLVSHKRE